MHSVNNTTDMLTPNGNSTPDEDQLLVKEAAIAVPILFGIVFILGVIGNGTLIYTVVRNKNMRNVPNVLIVSLSAGDLLLLLVSVPFASTYFTLVSWPFGAVICKTNRFLQTLSLGVSVFTLTALSVDRYLAIFDPMSKHTDKTMAKTVAVAVVIWIVSTLLAIPDLIFTRIMVGKNNVEFCSEFPSEYMPLFAQVSSILRFIVFFALPVITIAFFYLMMARILIKSGESMPCEMKGALNQQRQIDARKKVAKIVLSFVVIFIVCWLPHHIFLLWFWLTPGGTFSSFWLGFKIFGYCLKFINSCINPFALYFLSSQFRKHYNRYLFCCISKARYSNLEPSTTLHYFQSTMRRGSSTNATLVQSQSMC